ncbi:MAG TPA: magnesium-translocating P-type ATPase [Gemmatimonadales bacterium]|nr:magnesium-translocating P-type ATPase [Gemmatimonadales bacterium]
MKRSRWLFRLIGPLLLAAVVAAVLHLSEAREFVRLTEQAEPWWMVLALALQATTYFLEGEIWWAIGRAAGHALSRRTAYEIGFAKLFVDEAVPSVGIGGAVLAARAFEQRGLPRRAVMAGVVVTTASFHAAYVLSLGAALLIAVTQRQASGLIVAVSTLFALYGCALAAALLALSGRRRGTATRRLAGVRPLRAVLDSVAQADPRLARSPRLLVGATVRHLTIILLDAATIWTLIRSLGAAASPSGVFASFLFSSLFRTVAIVPGGLGAFEAASVLTLRMAGVALPVALSATLLFRALSFWLPMLPGLWFSRHAVGPRSAPASPVELDSYWALAPGATARHLGSSAEGLSSAEAARRLRLYGPNEIREQRPLSRLTVLLSQLRSPLLLLLVFAAGAAALTGAWLDALIVLTIVVATVGVGYSREYSARAATAALRARIRARAQVLRDRQPTTIPVEEVVPGDVVLLSAGSLVPADAVILEAADFFVSEAVLTGESFPVEKRPGSVAPSANLPERTNCVFLGTNVRSGTARCLVVRTGSATHFGAIAGRLVLRPPETEFDRGVRRFGYLLTSAMLVMVLLVFVAHMFRGRPPVETLLFSVALAVGLSPELLPAILSVNLARGAQLMAQRGVLVRRLNAIENLGSIDVLCTDKTGTLTEGVVRLEGAYTFAGAASAEALEIGACNAALETGLANPLDDAILEARRPDVSRLRKLAEIPFDFVRKRVSVVVEGPDGARLLMKGAFDHVLEACTTLADATPLDAAGRDELARRYEEWSGRGIRVLAVAARAIERKSSYDRDDERDASFVGFLTFLDRPKEDASQAVAELAGLGVAVKLITGDNRLVARHVAALVGMRTDRLLTGDDLDELHDEALWHAAERTDLFVEVDPNQKERIILSLKKTGHVVGFLGDGVNDAPAMHAADTSLSVEHAVDVAREAADFVLLERDLDVIRRGIEEGRRTFANTLKYVLTTTSANLGNMLSMAVASLFLPFLPLLAGQILLNNFLSDVPAVGLADDHVDPELVNRPRRWDMGFIGRFMAEFGVLSSAFDLVTFGLLLGVFRAAPALFRTGWFVESLLTELVIALVVRTRRPFFRSRPGTLLLTSTLALVAVTFAIPYLPFVGLLGFVHLPAALLAALAGITGLYVIATELLKRRFYRGTA